MSIFSKVISYFKTHRAFILSLIAIHAAYFMLAFFYEGICNGDSDEYLQTAENLKYHFVSYNWIWTEIKNPTFYSLRPPLYGFFIFVFKSIYQNDYFILFIQNILSVFTWILTLQIARIIKPGFKVEIPILICLILIPSQMIMINTIGADWMLQFWLTLALFLLVKYDQSQKASFFLGYTLALTLSVLTKPVMMYFWIPNLLLVFYLFYRNRNYKILIYSLILPLTIFCWSLRNESKTGLFHYSSIKTQNILDLNAGAVLIKLYGAQEAINIKKGITDQADKMENYPEKCDFIVQNAMRIIKENPMVYGYCHAKGMVNFMVSVGRYDLKNFFNAEFDDLDISFTREIEKQGLSGFLTFYFKHVNIWFTIFIVMAFLWNLVTLFGLIWFCLKSNFPLIIKAFIIVVVFYSAFVCGPGGDVRFKLAILPYLILSLFVFSKHSFFSKTAS